MTPTRLTLITVLIAGACAVPTAWAETFKGTLSAAKPSFAWSGYGAGGPGFECSNDAEFQCDSVVFKLEAGGDLNLSIDVEGEQITNPAGAAAYPNFDLYLFKADAAGAKTGDAIAESATPIDDEKLIAPGLSAGDYVLEVRSSLSIGENYSGKAKLTNIPAPPAVAPPAAAPAPSPAATPQAAKKPARKSTSRRACRAKASKIENRRKRSRALRRCARLKR